MSSEISKADLSEIDSDKYWELVGKTLTDIFSKNPSDAQRDAKRLENEIKNSSPDEQVLFYHSEPLSVAADIAARVPTPQEIALYKALRARIYGLP